MIALAVTKRVFMNETSKNVIAWVILFVVVAAGIWYFAGRPANAPTMPAGEMMEGGEEAAEAAVVGTWRSKQDSKFTREFRADGTIVDRYEGDDSATIEGSWSMANPAAVDIQGMEYDADAQLIMVNDPYESYLFKVNSVSETDLSLTYIGGAGGSLEFERI